MILLRRLIHVLSGSRVFILAAVFIISVSWLLGSPRALLDEILVRLQDDPTLSSHYDWPVKLQFDAPLELLHNLSSEASWLDIAIAEKMPDSIRPLVKAGIDVNITPDDGSADTALIYATGNGDYQSVRELLMLGANKNQKNKVGT